MFAYNEAGHIDFALKNVFNNVDDRLQNVYLLANGCTDNTIQIAEKTKSELQTNKLKIVEISIGDKCNAWNHYIHDIGENADCHFFVDADVIFSHNCFPILFDELNKTEPKPNIIGGYPLSGRNLDFYRWLIEERSCFFGNLYGATQEYIEMIRDKNFYMPVGLNWIDSFLTKAANTDIEFYSKNLPNKVIHKKGVGFEFESLSPFKWADIKLYKNRIARYELGMIQETYLDKLKRQDWPRRMHGINLDISSHFDEKAKHLGPIKKYLVKKRLHKLIAQEESRE
jgi:glycosyltransferase involved in cell wall biosynthesis